MSRRFPGSLVALSAVAVCLLAGCESFVAAPPQPNQWVGTFSLADHSQRIAANQGYASGISPAGVALHYFFQTGAVYLSRDWKSLDLVASNLHPLPSGTTHLGAGDYSEGHVYDVAEHWTACNADNGPIFIVVLDAATLQREKTVEITGDLPEASGIAIDPDTGEALVSSFCDANNIYVYRLSDWTLTGTIPLSLPVRNLQGLSYRTGFLYLAGNGGALYGLHLSDQSMRLLMRAPTTGEFEGLDFHSAMLRWLVNHSDGSEVDEYQPLEPW